MFPCHGHDDADAPRDGWVSYPSHTTDEPPHVSLGNRFSTENEAGTTVKTTPESPSAIREVKEGIDAQAEGPTTPGNKIQLPKGKR